MANDKRWPVPGDRLVHKFRKREGGIAAEVLSVDKKKGQVAVRVDDTAYPSLSAAAHVIAGHPSNRWVFWGLKKQRPRPSRRKQTGS